MGKLFDDIKNAKGETRRRNLIDDVLENLTDTERKDLLVALDDVTIPATVISKVIAKRGLKLPAASINRYRRGEVELPNGN
jgi:hypothetical protein